MKIDGTEDFDLVTERKKNGGRKFRGKKTRSLDILAGIIGQLESIYWGKDAEGNIITNEQMNDALTEELFELRDRELADVELSQLGLAVGVIHHEIQ